MRNLFGLLDDGLETPSVLLDRVRLVANIDRVAEIAAEAGVAVRPHIKTHKSLYVAKMQINAGAVGVTTSKTDEALVFIDGGLPSVTCAYPILDSRKLDRLLAAAQAKGCDLRLMVDSDACVAALHEAGERANCDIPVFIKIDVGLHRCGLAMDDPALPRLALRIHDSPHLHLQGILSHAGQAYGAKDAEAVRTIAREEARIMRGVKKTLEDCGLAVPEVSVGSTPTVLASDDYEGITEIRPGNYVFMDNTPVRLGLCDVSDVALTVLATVVSVNSSYALVDAGSKVLSSDGGAHGAQGSGGFGAAYPLTEDGVGEPFTVAKLSEEHGWLVREGRNIKVGDKVRILPNHSCPVANLTDVLHLLDEQGSVPLQVDARGRTL